MYEGKTQLTRIWVYKSEFAKNMDENIAVHTKWMEETHQRSGEKKLHFLNWSKAPQKKEGKETKKSPL